MKVSLEGRVALVTGCTGGIGSAISDALAEAGVTVWGADIPDSADDWATAGGSRRYLKLDVTNPDQWASALDQVGAAGGGLDILVNNAAIVVVDKLEATSLEEWRRQMAVNVDGPFLGTQLALPLLRASGSRRPHGASVINISSVAGLIGAPLHTGYCASKGALRLFTKACAMEFAALRYPVRVNSVHPSGVRTRMVEYIMQRFVDHGLAPDEATAIARTVAAHPIGRMADPVDIAKAVRFLASDESGYMHGAELVVDGGYTAQ